MNIYSNFFFLNSQSGNGNVQANSMQHGPGSRKMPRGGYSGSLMDVTVALRQKVDLLKKIKNGCCPL